MRRNERASVVRQSMLMSYRAVAKLQGEIQNRGPFSEDLKEDWDGYIGCSAAQGT